MTPSEFAIQVTQRLQEAGFQALWAGGCVRDQLLGKTPKDYDVATNATPPQIRELFGKRKTIAIGVSFGVITIIGPKSAGNIEVATFRRDSHYSDGRRPDSVEFSTAEMDAQRRDFTINGLFFDPVKEEVIDYVDGQTDLQRQLIRAIGNPAERIAEDKLRMLRAVRFAATLQFALDPETLAMIQRHAAEITIVSAERITAELTRMLVHPNRVQAVEMLYESGLLKHILPNLNESLKNAQHYGPLMERLRRLDEPTMAVAFATLLDQAVEADEFVSICRRLKMSNEVSRTGQWILKVKDIISKADQLPWSQVQPILTHKHVEQAVQFVDAKRSSDAVEFCHQRLAWPPENLDPPPLLDGRVLKENGISPGPLYSQIIGECRRAQLDGEISSEAEALRLAESMIREN